jgi:hypothetical protein
MRCWLPLAVIVVISAVLRLASVAIDATSDESDWSAQPAVDPPVLDDVVSTMHTSMDVDLVDDEVTAAPAYADHDLPNGAAFADPFPAVSRSFLLGVAFATLLLVRHFRRVNAVQRARPVPVSLLVVERLARAAQRRAGVIAAVGVVGVPALVVMHAGPLAIISTIVASIGLRGYGIARAVLEMVETSSPSVTADLLSHIVVVRSPVSEVQLEVAPRALARELRHAVPIARAKIR